MASTRTSQLRAAGFAVWIAAAGPAWAAGGHHALDDAAILEPRQCEAESWFSRSRGGQRLVHAGGACRAGPVELGLAAEHARQDGAGETGYSVQAKWAAELAPAFSAGLSLAAGWQAQGRPRFQGTTAVGLATWTPREDIALHLNLGRDFVRAGRDANRAGASVEWTPRENWSLTAERYVEERTHYVRAGVRWAVGDAWTVDASHAHRLRGDGGSGWTLGVTRLIGR